MNELKNDVIVWAIAIVLALLAIAALFLFRRLGAYIEIKRKNAIEGSVEASIWTVAQQGYAWAEREGKGLAGSDKADLAFQFAVKMLSNAGIEISAEKLKAAIEKAWIVLERVPRETSTVSPEQVQRAIKKEFENTLKRDT